jgi:hypothetical protein
MLQHLFLQQTLHRKCPWMLLIRFFGQCKTHKIDFLFVTLPKEVNTVLVTVAAMTISAVNFALEMPVIVIVEVNVEVSLGNATHIEQLLILSYHPRKLRQFQSLLLLKLCPQQTLLQKCL